MPVGFSFEGTSKLKVGSVLTYHRACKKCTVRVDFPRLNPEGSNSHGTTSVPQEAGQIVKSKLSVALAAFNSRTLVAFALASVLALASTPGHALSFDFSFTNFTGNVTGTVTGLIEGLTDNTTSSATDVIVESYPAGVDGVPQAPFTVTQSNSNLNTFTVANGLITSAFFFF